MPRPRTPFLLPPLEKAFRSRIFPVKNNESLTSQLATRLEDFIKQERIKHTQATTFYSIPCIRHYFRVSYDTAAKAYGLLQERGLLLKIRGSRTLLLPEKATPLNPVHSIVGLPVWETGYLLFLDHRLFYRALNEELNHRQISGHFIFFNGEECSRPEFGRQLTTRKLDHLVWHYPLRTYQDNLRTALDHGIKVRLINSPDMTLGFPAYHPDYTPALATAFKQWKERGIKQAFCVTGATPCMPHFKIMNHMAEINRISLKTMAITPQEEKKLHALRLPGKTALIFDDYYFDASILARIGQPYIEFMGRHVSLVTHHLDQWHENFTGIKMDFAVMDWTKVATQIATDISSGHTPPRPVKIPADYHPGAAATSFARMS